jgi:sulfide:quinone oxidoreductase
MDKRKIQILILGGGTAGITTAAQLIRKDKSLQIGIIEPSEKHFYQPAWTLVGAGTFSLKKTIRNEKDQIPKGVEWVKGGVASVIAEDKTVKLENGQLFTYDHLIVAVGIQINYGAIPGLAETIGKNGVCTNYDPKYAEYTFECLKNTNEGNALFSQAPTPIKCGGAPQKITYLAEHYFRKKKKRDKINVVFAVPGTQIFGVEKFTRVLNGIIKSRDIKTRFFHRLIEIRAEKREAVYELDPAGDSQFYMREDPQLGIRIEDGNKMVIPYTMLHLAPPQSAPDFIKESSIAVKDDPFGWVDVDKGTLRHNTFPEVWSLGDVSSLPCAKTGAAVRKQAPVLVHNLLTVIKGGDLEKEALIYTGYSSCPIVTQYGRMVLAEFDYDNKPIPSFPINLAKERFSMWILKKFMLPWIYWNMMLKGKEF